VPESRARERRPLGNGVLVEHQGVRGEQAGHQGVDAPAKAQIAPPALDLQRQTSRLHLPVQLNEARRRRCPIVVVPQAHLQIQPVPACNLQAVEASRKLLQPRPVDRDDIDRDDNRERRRQQT